ncbi:MAG TPA: T9SS type A sorting domain-containing protein [Bacteroidia bacterium]|nr:T9SS type A sorting domain-containing protein [Bacteroidia bacterium]
MRRYSFSILLFSLIIILRGQVNLSDIQLTNFRCSESSVFIHPDNPNIFIIGSNNLQNSFPLTVIGSFDGGISYSYFNIPQYSYADPAVCIDKSGNFYVNFLDNFPGLPVGIGYSNNNGISWNFYPYGGGNYDKPNIMIDLKEKNQLNQNNPFYNTIYSVWVQFHHTNYATNPLYNQIIFTKSNNSGANWIMPPQVLSYNVNAGCKNHSPVVRTGINGEIYVCWEITDVCSPDPNNIPEVASYLGFASSLDGGNTWNVQRIQQINGTTGLTNKYLRANSFPSMAVNMQNGHIYVVWTQQTSPSNNDIYFIKSTNNGLSWSSPIKVNQDNSNNDQWFPWIACDPINNAIVVIYLDSRNDPLNKNTDTYISISYDDGQTFNDYKINDNSWYPFGPLIGYDYIGVDAKFGKVIPVWSQGDNGIVYLYTQPFNIPCPQNLNLTYGNYFITDEVTFSEDAKYSAINSIIVANQQINGSTYKIYSGASVYMSAQDEIVINDGFESEGEFVAEIASCINFSSRVNNNSNNSKMYSNTISNSEFIIPKINEEGTIIAIFPNPAKFFLNITLSDKSSTIHHITIKDISGKIVLQQQPAPANLATLNVSELANGIYFVTVETTNSVFTEKLIIQK